jgi:hypothetical protein
MFHAFPNLPRRARCDPDSSFPTDCQRSRQRRAHDLGSAVDANGDPLAFNVANKPAWMRFNASTGKLGGTPSDAQAGRTFSGIRISVSDGTATTSLPSFWITVRTASGSSGSTANNVGPTISGMPKPTATVGSLVQTHRLGRQ